MRSGRLVSICALVSTLFLAGCVTTQKTETVAATDTSAKEVKLQQKAETGTSSKKTSGKPLADPAHMYRAMNDGRFDIPAVDVKRMKPEHMRQIVSYETNEPVGTVIVEQKSRYLYYVLPDNKAVRYAVGVGPAGRNFQGTATIAYKQAWPRWTPTSSMIKRNPKHYGRYKDGVEGGPKNPMGARALYIHQNGQDTYYRVHGTNAPWSIGKAVSAGCIRLLSQDIIDLHDRVKPGSRIIVR
ncbi:lipoprotein-anchoring transpeptidase ErfK/SrfK [Paenochrobactrum gallinarii]|uniref:Lipoprotein-anchoring transpeptidase ErfK/SrfK n=1 Tax=Paenochrobactrum gallinarii TaxID=643673 RepID=A0A841LZA3_9HYPH|nr:L,D-transpeptidase [Paenochrobactrum gallinarii]MBB6260949.1 lipoprotein-anchoring transpeptidase ErfK/SrfK [Paenochrobactrum gallinarii]